MKTKPRVCGIITHTRVTDTERMWTDFSLLLTFSSLVWKIFLWKVKCSNENINLSHLIWSKYLTGKQTPCFHFLFYFQTPISGSHLDSLKGLHKGRVTLKRENWTQVHRHHWLSLQSQAALCVINYKKILNYFKVNFSMEYNFSFTAETHNKTKPWDKSL